MSDVGSVSVRTAAVSEGAEPQRRRRAVGAASIGNVLEWYDFVIYAYFSTYIAKHFFPSGSETTSFLVAIATFGVGFAARPLGAIVLGAYGDRFGRKAALTVVVMLMAIGTGLIGVTPSYETIGAWAPVLIVVARLIQGFSSGGEWGGATSFIVEYAPANRRGLYGSLQQASLAIALLMGSLTGSLLTYLMEVGSLGEWGWRIPFVVGALVMGPLGAWLRNSVEESPAYRTTADEASSKSPLRQSLTGQWRKLFIGAAFVVGWTATNYLYLVYMPIYLSRSLHIAASEALLMGSIQVAWFMVLSPVMGRLSDLFGRRRIMGLGALLIVLGTYPIFSFMAQHPHFWPLVGALIVLATLMAMFTGPAPAWQAELFPASVRTTSISLSYNFSVTIFGGFAPFIASWLIAATGNVLSITFYITLCAVVSLLAVWLSQETSKRDLA